jgi:hypothetical protein
MSGLTTEPKPSEAPVQEAEPRVEKPKRSNSWEAKNAIIYDASNQTLSKDKKANINESTKAIELYNLRKSLTLIIGEHTKVTIPKRAKSPLVQDRVQLSVSYGSSSTKMFLADVRLSNLGLWVAIQRYWGNIDEMWVKGMPNASCKIMSVGN